MGVGAAIAGSALVGAYSSKKSADSQADASRSAASSQVAMNRQNIQFQREIFEQQREDNAPWREIGEQSLRQLQAGVKDGRFTPGRFDFTFEESPGYQFRRQEGINALDASASARGRLQSGAQARAVTRYGSDLASQEYGNAFNRALTEYGVEADRRGQQFNQLASLSNVGQVANQQTAAARGQMAQSVGQSTQATGNALAQGALGAGQARASGYQNMAGAANQGMQNYLLYNMMGS